MDCLNYVTLTGFVDRMPSVKFEAERGAQTTMLTLRVEETGKDGATFKGYVFIECYGRVAETAGDMNAGDLVGIEGRLKWRSYIDRDGQKKGTLAVLARQVTVFLSAATLVE